ncbi:MAG: hypothetical protein WA208_01570 [Thermoanaerobaculia bacterium]
MDFSICHDCGEPSVWGGAIVLALLIAAAVATGYLAARISARYRQVLAGSALTTVITIAVGVRVWIATDSVWAVLPFFAVFAGLFHRRTPVPSILPPRG